MDNDLYPNDGEYFDPNKQPEDLKQEISAEKAKVQSGLKLLNELIDRMSKRITFYDSIDSIAADVKDKPEEHLRNVLANGIAKANLEAERDYMVGLRDQYK